MEIFIPLAKKIKEQALHYQIIITISKNQSKEAKLYCQKIIQESLDSVIINVGSVYLEDIPHLYQLTDGLLLPTLLESYSGTYIEALFYEKPIFTSYFDFTKTVCKEAAFYFDPFNMAMPLNISSKKGFNTLLVGIKKHSRKKQHS